MEKWIDLMRRKHIFLLFSVITGVFFLFSWWAYQQTATYLNRLSDIIVEPAIPFSQFPMQMGPWQGTNVSISETVLKVAANDDYLSRTYVDRDRRLRATAYVAYTAEPRRMLGHRPRRCYTGSGWAHDETISDQFTTSGGQAIPILLHRFHWPGLDYQEVTVVNYYVVNGELTSDHRTFSGLRFRRPKVVEGRTDYVAQIQISSTSEAAAKMLAQELSDEILRHLPKAP